ncbi:uncharacterized protein [Zea mays]|uniref:Precursor elicitor peptide1 n=1 Tax=Zea mays TaxID=4577 RepID=A0A1D6DWZ4_MAIZE|nr:uncharacterized protein LOC100276987 isoform X1 [Zea mays]ONM13189.1 precursor elicitor peptide1 [Zea mays]|eukprot:XP_008668801.1 uncharacterized protein LOC103645871 isoform X2 [Zea mays]
MDERGEKEEEHGVVEEETAAVVLKEVEVEMEMVGGSEEASAAPLLLAHPCSLLQLLLRACAGCLVRLLHGHCSDGANDDPKAAADDDDAAPEAAAAAAAAAGDGGDKAATEVWAVRRRPTTPGRPREGSGGNGGNHH